MFREGILDEVGGNRSMKKKWKSFLEKLKNRIVLRIHLSFFNSELY